MRQQDLGQHRQPGALYPLEIYVVIAMVEGIEAGYRSIILQVIF